MSNYFEEFNSNEPELLDVRSLETEDQMILRNYFELMTERAQADIKLFDPEDPTAFREVRLAPRDGDLESIDSALSNLLARNMVKTLNLTPPEKLTDPRYMLKRVFKDKSRIVIFSIDRGDEPFVPVYGRLDKHDVPTQLQLISYQTVHNKVTFYKEWDECRTKLIKEHKVDVADLVGLTLAQLKEFVAYYEIIQGLNLDESS